MENKIELKRFHIPEYELGDIVYLRTDPDQLPRIILGYRVYDKNISYILTHNNNESYNQPIEFSSHKTFNI